MLRHETPFRGADKMVRLDKFSVAIFGAGALGSNLAFTLAKQGVQNISVFDDDRVEAHNIGTQIYGPNDVGQLKTAALYSIIYDASGVEIKHQKIKVSYSNAQKLARSHDVLVDCFDNSESRAVMQWLARNHHESVVHAGFNGAYAEVKWDRDYRVPSDDGEDICEYPLARNLVTLTVSLLAETIMRYALGPGDTFSSEITFNDLSIHII